MLADSVRFVFVDVFASRPLTGNPLALVPDADDLSTGQMRAIAREFNQSETTFVLRPTVADADWRLRSFTPAGVEVGGAGHNALGAWLWLADQKLAGSGDFVQQIGQELLPVTIEAATATAAGARVRMRQSTPVFSDLDVDADAAVAALGRTPDDLSDDTPTRAVSTGVAHLLVPVRTRATVDALQPDPHALKPVLRAAGGEGCYVFTTEPGADGAHAYARFFNPTVGIVEDPATGTAAGPLAAALVRAGHVPDGTEVVIEQGHTLGRPSRLTVRVDGQRIELSGSGLVVGQGRLAI